MSRNKYPEKTIEKILEVSLTLFNEKGYEKTTIQDIVNALGMSKGAIYHHFHSKAEILKELGNRYAHTDARVCHLVDNKELSGLDKLKEFLYQSIQSQEKQNLDTISIDLWKNPKVFVDNMADNLNTAASFLGPMLEEGMKDGSIQQQDVTCCSQILTLLLDYWICSPIALDDHASIVKKIAYLRLLCDNMGIPLIDDALEQQIIEFFQRMSSSVNKKLP